MLEIEADFTVQGHKSSEGDGRTAADLEREYENQRRRLLEMEKREEITSQEETD